MITRSTSSSVIRDFTAMDEIAYKKSNAFLRLIGLWVVDYLALIGFFGGVLIGVQVWVFFSDVWSVVPFALVLSLVVILGPGVGLFVLVVWMKLNLRHWRRYCIAIGARIGVYDGEFVNGVRVRRSFLWEE